MKPKNGFAYASREMLDAWISSGTDSVPEQVYRSALKLFTASMVLAVCDDQGKCLIVRGYQVPSVCAPIVDEIARERLERRHLDAQKQARPIATKEIVEEDGKLTALEFLLLPRKGGGWCIAMMDFQLMLPIPRTRVDHDDVDRAILQLLCEGCSGKEIGQQLGFSHRTIEHRVERLKQGFGARSIAQLVALSITDGLRSSG